MISRSCCNGRHKKGAWTLQEDQKLIDCVKIHGEGCWQTLPEAAGLRPSGRSCMMRWINYLRPETNFGEDEEDLIIRLHALLGNRWSLIAGRLPGRTDNEVKDHWDSRLKGKLVSMGVDPNNHRVNESLRPICTCSNKKRRPNISDIDDDDDTKLSVISRKHPSKKPRFSKDHTSGSISSRLNEQTLHSSCDLNLNLTIGDPSNPYHFRASEKKKDVISDELNGITADENPTGLMLFI